MDLAVELKRLRYELAGWSQQMAADLCEISLEHYQRMEAGRKPAKGIYVKLLSVFAAGIIPGLPGWRCIDGQLVAPNNNSYTPGEIEGISYHLALISALKTEVRKTRENVPMEENNVIIFPELKRL